MSRDESVRAVVRVLELLRVMNQRPIWTLHELHEATGLPKATLSRLLATLRSEGYARPEQPAGTWRLAARARELGAGYTQSHALVDQGRTLMLETTRRIKWPLALGMLDTDAVVVRFSTMPYSPLAVHTTTLGHRLGLIDTAMGRAYLAFCHETIGLALLNELCGADSPEARATRRWLQADLAQIRRDGYAVRQPNASRGTATVAVPVLSPTPPQGGVGADGGDALAVLGITTFGKAMTPAFIARHVPLLEDTARRLAELADA